MKLAYTLHRINNTIEPGQVIEMSNKDYGDMLKFSAVREPTDQEKALWQLSNPVTEPSKSTGGDLDRTLVIARAEELGLEFKKNIGTAKLAERIAEAEKAADDLLG